VSVGDPCNRPEAADEDEPHALFVQHPHRNAIKVDGPAGGLYPCAVNERGPPVGDPLPHSASALDGR